MAPNELRAKEGRTETMARIDVQLGNRLRSRRRELDLTLFDLGDLTGLKPQRLQNYECGAAGMSAAIIVKLAVALEVQVGYFFEGLLGLDTPYRPLLATCKSRCS
jgi:transcriptional regulator with XRE-family HTH domain